MAEWVCLGTCLTTVKVGRLGLDFPFETFDITVELGNLDSLKLQPDDISEPGERKPPAHQHPKYSQCQTGLSTLKYSLEAVQNRGIESPCPPATEMPSGSS